MPAGTGVRCQVKRESCPGFTLAPGHRRSEGGWLWAFPPAAAGRVIWQRRANPNMSAEHEHRGHPPGSAACRSGGAVLWQAAAPGVDGAVTWDRSALPSPLCVGHGV